MKRAIASSLLLAALAAGACIHDGDPPPADHEVEGARLLAAGDVEKALAAFRESAYGGTGTYRSLIGIALCQAHLARAAAFEAWALEASSAAPRTPAAHARLGAMYVQGAECFRTTPGGRRYAAVGVEYLRRVFAADPDHPNVLHNLGLGLHLTGDDLTAQLLLEEAYQRDPSRLDLLGVLLRVLRRLDRKERVAQLLTPLVRDGNLPDAWKGIWTWSQ